jgi:hypothetical protein
MAERQPEYRPTEHPLTRVNPSIGQPLRPHYPQAAAKGLPKIYPHFTKRYAHMRFLLILAIIAILVIGFIVIFTLVGEERPTLEVPIGPAREGPSPMLEEVAEIPPEEAAVEEEFVAVGEEIAVREGFPEEDWIYIPVIAGKDVVIDDSAKGIRETQDVIKIDLDTAAQILEEDLFGPK